VDYLAFRARLKVRKFGSYFFRLKQNDFKRLYRAKRVKKSRNPPSSAFDKGAKSPVGASLLYGGKRGI
jgi:hypothetical protein